MTAGSLKEYRKKRDFSKAPRYVIQKHDASHLHYDLRLQIGGVLKSWAVPKGPSCNPRQRRLAVETEDHPVSYADFEGVIPQDAYGGGTVMVWDTGTFKSANDESLSKQYDDGKLEIDIRGKKLRGKYVLVKTRGKSDWLLIKMKDRYADARRNPVSTEPDSARSGKSLEAIAGEASG